MKAAIVNDELLKVVNVVKANSLSDVSDGVMAESWMAPNAEYTIESGVRTPIPVPPLTDDEIQKETNEEARSYLAKTDWYAIRFAETGEIIPSSILVLRAEARSKVI